MFTSTSTAAASSRSTWPPAPAPASGRGRGLSGWLRPGDRLEVAGREIELLEVRLDGRASRRRSPAPATPLDDAGDAPLAPDALPRGRAADPLVLDSELVFVGRSSACGVPVDSPSALRVHCVLVRGPHGAYVVDLVGRGTWRNGQPVRGAAPARRRRADDRLVPVPVPGRAAGRRPTARLRPAWAAPPPPPPRPPLARPRPAVGPGPRGPADRPPLHLVPPEAGRGPRLADEPAPGPPGRGHRRQSDFQTELVRLVAEIHRDNQSILQRHLERADAIHREMSEIREAMKRRSATRRPPTSRARRPPPPP